MTVGTFVMSANEVTIAGFWRERRVKTRKKYEILRFLSPCWKKKYMDQVFHAAKKIFLKRLCKIS